MIKAVLTLRTGNAWVHAIGYHAIAPHVLVDTPLVRRAPDRSMKIHAIQTGSVRIKRAQAVGQGRGIRRQLAIFTEHEWTDGLPTYAWAIEHPEGLIVVDTGQGSHLLDHAKLLHPYLRWEVAFRIEREQEIGPQLRALGVGPRDVRRVILTHLHVDHDGGLAHFKDAEIHVARGEIKKASGWMGTMRGHLPNRWPAWFEPVPLDLVHPHSAPSPPRSG